jgi:hypothetical protein
LELKQLVEFLTQAAGSDDLRVFLRDKLKLDKLIDYNLEE